MRFSTFFSASVLSAAASGSALILRQGNGDFVGNGRIDIIRGNSNGNLLNPNHIIGCLTITGRWTADRSKCGVFNHSTETAQLTTSAGRCTLFDPTQEEGRPMAPQSYAFTCGNGQWSDYPAWAIRPTSNSWYVALGPGYLVYEVEKTPSGGEEVPFFNYAKSPKSLIAMVWRKI
ncbi:hypothetical protein DM02DRAFT_661530 [Periconia macrospinosa]|uniref:AA1-like domain-containing protein n=1 Tax=Periconia macrospinosa TaxID=97972 RepID=A0A2V1D768_9PLEO|nr:hypothetical protein DM02DRAFT_661530 [Periconia macrospinosa]